MGVTGIILAGGKNVRLGRNKAIEKVGGINLIERVVGRLEPITSQLIIVVARENHRLPKIPQAKFVIDIFPDSGPLGGIYTGLKASMNDTNIVVACDMPFLSTALLGYMSSIINGYDAIVPRSVSGMYEPLHSVYSSTCLPFIKKHLDDKQLAIVPFLSEIKVYYVGEKEYRFYDPSQMSFFNINQQIDLDIAAKLAESE